MVVESWAIFSNNTGLAWGPTEWIYAAGSDLFLFNNLLLNAATPGAAYRVGGGEHGDVCNLIAPNPSAFVSLATEPPRLLPAAPVVDRCLPNGGHFVGMASFLGTAGFVDDPATPNAAAGHIADIGAEELHAPPILITRMTFESGTKSLRLNQDGE